MTGRRGIRGFVPLLFLVAATLVAPVSAVQTVTEVIDAAGDGVGNALDGPQGLAVGPGGEIYVAGSWSSNVFRITGDGSISEILDAAGDGAGGVLDWTAGLAVRGPGYVLASGFYSDNALAWVDLATVGTNYCGPANRNSTGAPAEIAARGSEVVADNLLRLEVTSLPTGRMGYFLNSQTQAFVPFPGGSQGNLCLGGAIGRHRSPPLDSGSEGAFALDVDLTSLPVPGGTYAVVASETWNFQAWFRDINPGFTSNFTDAASLVFR